MNEIPQPVNTNVLSGNVQDIDVQGLLEGK